jgi:hypothetical protein
MLVIKCKCFWSRLADRLQAGVRGWVGQEPPALRLDSRSPVVPPR